MVLPAGGIINTLVQDTPAPPCPPSVRRAQKPDHPLLHFYTPPQKPFRSGVKAGGGGGEGGGWRCGGGCGGGSVLLDAPSPDSIRW